jgi:acid stress-induced BolA-like protein IbaG/YrbA
MNKETIQSMIEQGLPGAQVDIVGDDGQHFQATVTCPEFKGKTMLAMHRMVYETLGDKMGNEIHALSLRTKAA